MTKWKHYSLEWIHDVRKKNYQETKQKELKDIINESVQRVKKQKDKKFLQ